MPSAEQRVQSGADGMHRRHVALIRRAEQTAAESGGALDALAGTRQRRQRVSAAVVAANVTRAS